MQAARFRAALDLFDAANRQDPIVVTVEGQAVPKELVYARQMTGWLDRLSPDASEALRLAARCQHICRWMIPRSRYPMTRAGYHRWRSELARFHADKAAEILRQVGYDEATIARVQSLLRKERLKDDPETQMLEDVICLVFLENYLPDFAQQHAEPKVIEILRKTWRKMSARGQEAALTIPLPRAARTLIDRALGRA